MKQVLKHSLSPIDGMLVHHKATGYKATIILMIYTVQANVADELNYCKTEPKLVIRRGLFLNIHILSVVL